MKYFIFRKDENGFHDWIKSVNHFRWAIRTHQAAKYEEDYTPTKLTGFETLDATTRDISKASVMNGAEPGTYIVYETIYDISGTNPVIATKFVVDNRTA